MCEYCCSQAKFAIDPLVFDHIQPVSRGGKTIALFRVWLNSAEWVTIPLSLTIRPIDLNPLLLRTTLMLSLIGSIGSSAVSFRKPDTLVQRKFSTALDSGLQHCRDRLPTILRYFIHMTGGNPTHLHPKMTDPNIAIRRCKECKSLQKDFFKRYLDRGVIRVWQ
jgi:hypothetical protein